MDVLITGGAGFIGSHIVDVLVDRGYRVIIADNLVSGNRENINPDAVFYEIDIRDGCVEKVFQEHEIKYVIHQAAQVNVNCSMKDPYYDMTQNIGGTINLLNLCKKYSVEKIIAASSAAVYSHPEYLPIDEKHNINNFLSFYGLSKYAMENYIKLFGIDYFLLRYSNVYGPRQDANGEAGVVSVFIDRATQNKNIEIHGDGEQTRDFVFVKEVAKANLACLESDNKNKIINISSNSRISINDLFNIIKKHISYNKEPHYTHARPGDIKHSILDNRAAEEILNWKNTTDLCDGINQTIQWKLQQ